MEENIKTEELSNVEPLPTGNEMIDIFENKVAIQKWREIFPDKQDLFNEIGSRIYPNNRTLVSNEIVTTDFTDAQHTHANAAGGGQLNPSTALSSAVPVSKGGSGATTLTGILKGNGTSAFTAIAPLAGTKQYYVADSSGGAVTRRLTFTDGILTSES